MSARALPRLKSTFPTICVTLCALLAVPWPTFADDAAANYLFAILELPRELPDYVSSATTDSPDHGFATSLTAKQVSFLQRRDVVSILVRFDQATSCRKCTWNRYSSLSWSDSQLNHHLHELARIVLLRARVHYESGHWIEGNRDVERVRVLARHISLQARPFEHQCFMVENMSIGTAAAYLLRFPDEALSDISERNRRLDVFSPMSQMLRAEVERIRVLLKDFERDSVTHPQLRNCIRPHLASDKDTLGGSKEDVIRQLSDLSAFMEQLAPFMDQNCHAEEQIARLAKRHAQTSRLVAGLGDWPVEEYRENAQGVCRGIIFESVIKCLREGREDFSKIDDPYGNGYLKFQAAGTGFNLTSELTHLNQIGLQFGLAGLGIPGGHRLQSSDGVGRNPIPCPLSLPADR